MRLSPLRTLRIQHKQRPATDVNPLPASHYMIQNNQQYVTPFERKGNRKTSAINDRPHRPSKVKFSPNGTIAVLVGNSWHRGRILFCKPGYRFSQAKGGNH